MASNPGPHFRGQHHDFRQLTGNEAKIELLLSSPDDQALYHEACVYHTATRSVFVTSNQLLNSDASPSPSTSNKHIKFTRVYDIQGVETRSEELVFPGVYSAMLNGGVNYQGDSLLFCAQGSQDSDHTSGIVTLRIPEAGEALQEPEVLVSDFYGIPFNSVNDVIVHPSDGSIWFTDPCYGYGQGIRPKPALPNHVYRFDPSTKSIRAMADGFVRPNGLCFSPDLKTLYVTDTGAIHGSPDVPIDFAGPSSIYAFDVIETQFQTSPTTRKSSTFLTNKRLFAYSAGRLPDGIKCDTVGNVYSGCCNGIEIWNAGGELLGIIVIDGGVANFCFGQEGVIYACNETKFWKISLDGQNVKGALLGI